MASLKQIILENQNRKRIFSLVESNQGIHLRELQRRLAMPLTTLEYHLSYMEKKKIIYGEKENQFRRYYTNCTRLTTKLGRTGTLAEIQIGTG